MLFVPNIVLHLLMKTLGNFISVNSEPLHV